MGRNPARIAAVAAMLAGIGIATAGTAAAAPPERVTMHINETFPSRTSKACGFNILLNMEGTISYTDFYDRHGNPVRSLVTYPRLFYTFINGDTGESVTSRSPNPEHFTWNADGSFTIKVTGLVMNIAGSGKRAIQAGQFLITVDATGEATESEPVGRTDDYHAALCEALAP